VPRRPTAREIDGLHRWLDDELRAGRSGRLASEYPLTMGPGGSRRHLCIYDADRAVAHAMSHVVRLRARGRQLPIGMIGNVLTAPDFRRRGLAGACIAAAVDELCEAGAALALLWSDRQDLYARHGFLPAGREQMWNLRGARAPTPSEEIRVGPVLRGDLPSMEALYAAKPVRVEREAGSLGLLCAAPETEVAVARSRSSGEVLAYAAAGRGDDFPGIVHEWAGVPDAVLHCVERLRRESAAHTLLASPGARELEGLLAGAGATPFRGVFALVRILDAVRLWQAIGPRDRRVRFSGEAGSVTMHGPSSRVALPDEVALELFFGAGPEALPQLPPDERHALAGVLPWPLYVWGFDSI